jgi:hypothetical protein
MAPPPLNHWQSPASPLIALTWFRQSRRRPQQRAGGMLQHSAPLADHLHGPDSQLLFIRARVCEVAESPPCSAWRMRYAWTAAGPVASIAFHVPHIDSFNGLVVRVHAGKQRRNGGTRR